MGIIVSRFRKKQTTEEILDGIDKRVKELQKFRYRNQQLKKQYIGSLILYSIIIYILAALVFYFYYLPETWMDRFLYSIPLLIFPVMVWLLKKFLHWWFVKRIAQNDIELEEIRSKKKQILEEVMETETYKKAKEILEKYDPDRFKKVEKTIVVTPKPVIPPGSSGLRQRSIGSRAPTPQSGRGRGLSPGATPRLPHGRGSPMQPRQIMSGGRGQQLASPYNRPPGPPLPRPVLPRERGKMDKLVEYFVGDGPQNRYALICRYCHSHNGMALKEEFEYLTFRCCYCYQLNPARKQRPYAPKIDFSVPSTPALLTKTPAGPVSQIKAKEDVKNGTAGIAKVPDKSDGDDDAEDEDEDEEDEEDMEIEEHEEGDTERGGVDSSQGNGAVSAKRELSQPTIRLQAPDGMAVPEEDTQPETTNGVAERDLKTVSSSGAGTQLNGHHPEATVSSTR